MKTLRNTLVAATLAFVLAQPDTAFAGELVPRPRRVMTNTGGSQARIIRRSTMAAKRLSNARSSRPMSLRESNPYEARIAAISREQRQYDVKVARYNYRIEAQETRAEQKVRRNKEREALRQQKKLERIQDKERREQLRLARDKQKSATSTARAFFGSSKPTQDPLGQEVTAAADTNRRPTLWQRLKAWLFGGSSSNGKL